MIQKKTSSKLWLIAFFLYLVALFFPGLFVHPIDRLVAFVLQTNISGGWTLGIMIWYYFVVIGAGIFICKVIQVVISKVRGR